MASFIYDTIAELLVSWVSDYMHYSCGSLYVCKGLDGEDQIQQVCKTVWNLLEKVYSL